MLDTATAETDLLALLDDMAARTADSPKARRDYAKRHIGIIAALIRTGSVSGTGTVITAGTAVAQSGTATLTKLPIT